MVVLEIFPRIFLSPKIIFVQFFDFKIITEGTAKFFKYFRKYYNNISATIFFHFFQKDIIAKQRNNTEKMIQREKNFKHFSLSKISWIAENIVETRAARAVSTGINLIESSHSRLTFISRSPHCRARSFAFVAIATDWQIPRSSLRFIVPFNPICRPRLSVSCVYIYIYHDMLCLSLSGIFSPPLFFAFVSRVCNFLLWRH